MTLTQTPTPNPPRLVEQDDAAGALLRASLPEYAAGLPARARASVAAPKASRGWWPVALAGAACAAALALFLPAEPRPSPPAPSASARGPVIVPLEAPTALPESLVAGATQGRPAEQRSNDGHAKHRLTRTVALRSRPQPLEAGEESALADGSWVRLGSGGVASVSVPERERTVVALARGTVALVVAKRRPGERFEVHAGPYVFRVIGTSFTVDLRAGQARLTVAEGTVAVSAADHELGRITAGGAWNGQVDVDVGVGAGVGGPAQAAEAPLAPETVTAPPAADVVPAAPVVPFAAPERQPSRALRQPSVSERPEPARARVPASSECLGQARAGATKSAAGCLEVVAAGHGLEAEIALVELARLRRDALDDAKGALAALADYRARFPQGVLHEEALAASVDLLVRTGDGRGALAESDRLLRRVSNEQRRAELHLLRGNIFRVLEGDCRRADGEYAAAGKAQADRVVDDAAFWRAVCQASVGERAAAARAFTLYLERPRPQHAAEAKSRLESLRR